MSVENTHYGAEKIGDLFKDLKKIFFIGVGGINMSSLAHLTLTRGYEVGGSDRTRTELTERLEASGVRIYYGHSADNIEGYDAAVYTVAISPDNEEYRYAKEHGVPLISRADYMGYIMMSRKNRIGISGMHGKSTCTSMCAKVFMDAGVDPTVLSGAELQDMGGAYRIGSGDDLIFEACEYMDSFLSFRPNVSVILNIEMDHVDYFKSLDQIKASFRSYSEIALGDGGVTVANFDDENVREALGGLDGEIISFGIENEAAYVRALNISSDHGKYRFDMSVGGEMYENIALGVTGYYNIYNALATAAVAVRSGISIDDIRRGLLNFSGAKRRMEYKGSFNGAEIYEDYGHHPTEIRSTLEGAAGLCEGRLFCVYQPHTYSRTAALFDDFVKAFGSADRIIFANIYAAREVNTYGVSSELLADRIGDRAVFGGSFQDIAKLLMRELRHGDVAVIMGAGDIYRVFEHLELERVRSV